MNTGTEPALCRLCYDYAGAVLTERLLLSCLLRLIKVVFLGGNVSLPEANALPENILTLHSLAYLYLTYLLLGLGKGKQENAT